MSQEFSRRRALRAGTAAAGTVVLGSLAGCEQIEQFTGDGDDSNGETTEIDDEDDENDEPSGPYREWLPEPAAFDEEHYFFRYIDYEQFRANESNFDPEVYARDSQEQFLSTNFDLSDQVVDGLLFITPVDGSVPAVVTGSFSASDITEYLTDNGYEEEQEIGEFTVLANPSQGVLGITDGTLILSGDDSVDQIRTLVETKRGNTSRYTESSDAMATLLGRFGPEAFVGGTTNDPITEEEADPDGLQFTGQTGYAYSETVNSDTTTTEIAVLFETEDDVNMDAISEYTSSEYFTDYNEISSTQEGRMVIITGTVPTDELYTN